MGQNFEELKKKEISDMENRSNKHLQDFFNKELHFTSTLIVSGFGLFPLYQMNKRAFNFKRPLFTSVLMLAPLVIYGMNEYNSGYKQYQEYIKNDLLHTKDDKLVNDYLHFKKV